MAKRLKLIPRSEFDKIAELGWEEVRLKETCIPKYLQGIPADKLHSVYASGTRAGAGYDYSDNLIGTAQLIGTMNVFRFAPDDPVELNKDWYAVVMTPANQENYLISGPFADDEHWIDEIPDRFNGTTIWGVPKKDRFT